MIVEINVLQTHIAVRYFALLHTFGEVGRVVQKSAFDLHSAVEFSERGRVFYFHLIKVFVHVGFLVLIFIKLFCLFF